MKNVILASGSPRRKEILSSVGPEFDVIPSSADEKSDITDPAELVKHLSRVKAADVFSRRPESIVIGADTVVYLPGYGIMGKPSDRDDAFRMISALSGKTHEVHTGVTVADGGDYTTFSSVTYVTFKKISEDEISAYVSSGEPYDKAGGYAVQGKACLFVEKLDGDYYNVVGLPISPLYDILKKKGVRFWDRSI